MKSYLSNVVNPVAALSVQENIYIYLKPLLTQIIMSTKPIIRCIQDLYLCADIKELENKNIFFSVLNIL